MDDLTDTEQSPVPSAAHPQAHFNQFQLTSQHCDVTSSDTALYSQQYDLGASIYVIQHLEQELPEPQADHTLKPHNIQYSHSPVAVNTQTSHFSMYLFTFLDNGLLSLFKLDSVRCVIKVQHCKIPALGLSTVKRGGGSRYLCDITRQTGWTGTKPIFGHKWYINWDQIKIPPLSLSILYTAKEKRNASRGDEVAWYRYSTGD